MKVLIVDDAKVIRTINRAMLQDNGIPDTGCFEAADGAEALEIARKEDIDLFLIDWNMPKLDGLELLKEIRKTEKYAKTPVIMITSEAAAYNIMDAVDAGVTNYIVKPVKAHILWAKIKPHLAEAVTR